MVRHRDGAARAAKDHLAVEEPLEIRVTWEADGRWRTEPLAVTMRTPGDDFELVAGFLFAEGVVEEADALAELTYCRGGRDAHVQTYNVVDARLRPGVVFDVGSVRRNVYTSSSCGVCGKASIEAVEARGLPPLPVGAVRVDADLLHRLPEALLGRQGTFERTGGLHAAGLFTPAGEAVCVREDVGRHNAVDKVVGWALLGRELPVAERILVVSGRSSFEIVQKAVCAGVPVVVAVGAPSSLAVELARRAGQTLVGFARDGGCNVYSGQERVR